MIDVKCKGCDKLLAKANSMNAAIKCPRCKMIFEYKIYSNLIYSNLTMQADSVNLEVEPTEVTEQ